MVLLISSCALALACLLLQASSISAFSLDNSMSALTLKTAGYFRFCYSRIGMEFRISILRVHLVFVKKTCQDGGTLTVIVASLETFSSKEREGKESELLSINQPLFRNSNNQA